MRMKRLHLSLLAVVVLLVAAIGAVFAAPPRSRAEPRIAEGSCRYEAAVGFPSWVTSGVWSHDRLLIVDVGNRKLFEVGRSGVAYESHSALGAYLAGSNITRIRAASSDPGRSASPVAVEFAGGKLLDLDRALTPKRKFEMATDTLRSGDYKMGVLIDWVPTGDGRQVVGYADIEGPEDGFRRWRNGFVRFDLENPSRFSIVRERLFPDDARVAMNITYRLMASIGSTAYVALVDDQMGLYRFGPADQELVAMRAFPAHLDGKLAPLLPSYASAEELPRTMKAVEQSTMPAGLYAWEGHLFLLSRTVELGQRAWYLSKIDPERDELLWTVPVPGTSHHILVVPGEEEWAFLEKGPVVAARNQATHHVRFVRSEQMRSSSLKRLCD